VQICPLIKYQHAQKGVARSHQKYCVPPQDETTTLETLLNYDQAIDLNTKAQIIVMPRLGTISPWSSKCLNVFNSFNHVVFYLIVLIFSSLS
jgi:hypothetical protein